MQNLIGKYGIIYQVRLGLLGVDFKSYHQNDEKMTCLALLDYHPNSEMYQVLFSYIWNITIFGTDITHIMSQLRKNSVIMHSKNDFFYAKKIVQMMHIGQLCWK